MWKSNVNRFCSVMTSFFMLVILVMWVIWWVLFLSWVWCMIRFSVEVVCLWMVWVGSFMLVISIIVFRWDREL